ncbi:hypothetical protein ACLKA6_002663 [Drosophila palustris]
MSYCNFCRKHVQGVKYIHAPKSLEKRALWEQTLGCTFGEHSKICDTHFNASQWKSVSKNGNILKRRRLNDDAVPQRESGCEPKLGYADSSTQTEDKVINHTMHMENERLRAQIRRMEKDMHSLRQQLEDYQELEKWLADVKINAGTLDVVIDLMENEDMPEVDKLCVLSFDEMKVAAAFEYDSSADVVYEPSNYVQLAIVRGLIKSWKQPVFFDFSTRMDVDTLHSIINKLHKRGYPEVAIVSDLGSGNQRLWRELGISETKTWFSHPADENSKIFVFSDTPHLIKLVRNHYVDSGLVINGNRLTKTTVQQTISHCAKSDVSILFKITDNHINIGSLAKQRVKLATQLFSNTTSSSIRRCYALGYDVENACETADLFKILNDWFDVFNSKLSTSNSIESTQPYGKQIEIQRGVLAKMSEIMRSEIVGKAHKLPFQKGILSSGIPDSSLSAAASTSKSCQSANVASEMVTMPADPTKTATPEMVTMPAGQANGAGPSKPVFHPGLGVEGVILPPPITSELQQSAKSAAVPPAGARTVGVAPTAGTRKKFSFTERRSAGDILQRNHSNAGPNLSADWLRKVEWARSVIPDWKPSSKALAQAKRQRSQDTPAPSAKKSRVQPGRSFAQIARERILIGVLDRGNLEGGIPRNQWRWVESALATHCFNLLEKEPGPPPSAKMSGGSRVMSSVGEVYPGAKLEAVNWEDVPARPRARMWFPSTIKEPEQLLKMLQRCNPRLPTHDWRVAKIEETPGPTHQAVIMLDKPVEEDITAELEAPERPELDGYNSDASSLTRDLSKLWQAGDLEVTSDLASEDEDANINLHHCKAASAALLLRLAGGGADVVLIQEPWMVCGKVSGLGSPDYKLFVANTQVLRTTQQRYKIPTLVPPKLKNSTLTFSESARYLGLVLDRKLNWNLNIQERFWWPALKKASTIKQLNKIQRMAEICITGALNTTPGEALDAILNITPIRQLSEEISTLSAIRLRDTNLWNEHPSGHSSILLNKNNFPPKTDYCMPIEHLTTPFRTLIPRREEWAVKPPGKPGSLTFYTDGSKLKNQAEILAIKEAIDILKISNVTSGSINIYSDSQAAIKSIAATTTNSISVSKCRKSLHEMAGHFDICLIWVPGHQDIPGNCIVDELARIGTTNVLLPDKEDTSMPLATCKLMLHYQSNHKSTLRWQASLVGRVARQTWPKIDKARTVALCNLSRRNCSLVVRSLTGHWSCRDEEEEESPEHFFCSCPALSSRRLRTLGKPFLDNLGGLSAISPRKIALFIQLSNWIPF